MVNGEEYILGTVEGSNYDEFVANTIQLLDEVATEIRSVKYDLLENYQNKE